MEIHTTIEITVTTNTQRDEVTFHIPPGTTVHAQPRAGRASRPWAATATHLKNKKQEPEGKYKPITSEFEAEYNLRQLRGDIGLTTPHVIGAQLRDNK